MILILFYLTKFKRKLIREQNRIDIDNDVQCQKGGQG
jgi:hypothetical protein